MVEETERRGAGPAGPAGGTTGGLSPSARFVLACLRQCGGRQSVVRLARDLARQREGPSPSSARVRETYRRLRQTHLGQLTAAGLVEYSEEDGTVRLVSQRPVDE